MGHESAECRWRVAGIEEEDADCRRCGGQHESEEYGEVGGVWIVGNVVELEEEGEGTGRLGCRSKYSANEDLTVRTQKAPAAGVPIQELGT